jgi:hypothetical protein
MNMSGNKMKTIWLQRMATPQIVAFLVQGSVGMARVLYDEHRVTAMAMRVLGVAKKLGLCENFHPAALTMADVDSLGFTFYRKTLEATEECLESLCKKYVNKPGRWHNKMVKSYLASFLGSHFAFLTMVESRLGSEKCAGKYRNTVVLIRTPFNSAIKCFYSGSNFVIKESGYIDYFRHYVKPLYYLAMIILSKILPGGVCGNCDKNRPAVWVECSTIGSFVDFAFWSRGLRTDDYDIVCYFDRAGERPDAKLVSSLESRGFKWLHLRFFSLLKLSGFRLSAIMALFRKSHFPGKEMPLWLKVLNFEYNMWFLLYESLFKRFKVKILIQHQEASWRQGPQLEALESAGGIMVGYHWSNHYHSLLPSHLFPHHVYFVWGNWEIKLMRKIGNSSRHILPSGLWIVKDDNAQRQINGLSEDLDFVMAIFDSSIAYNTLNTPASLSRFYLNIIKLLEENASWGCIVKNKCKDFIELVTLPCGSEITSRMKALMEQRRLAVLDCSYNPLVASTNADLSVCYSFNSAGIVSAIHGYNVIHWDCVGISPRLFCDDPTQKVIYSSFDELKKAIIRSAAGDRTVGDFSKWRNEFNYFDDFLAPNRIGQFIQSFMDKVLKSGDADRSLRLAVETYISENKVESKMTGEYLEETKTR